MRPYAMLCYARHGGGGVGEPRGGACCACEDLGVGLCTVGRNEDCGDIQVGCLVLGLRGCSLCCVHALTRRHCACCGARATLPLPVMCLLPPGSSVPAAPTVLDAVRV